MVKNLLARIGLTVILLASTVLYQGFLKAMSYQEKCDDVMFQLEQRERTGDYSA